MYIFVYFMQNNYWQKIFHCIRYNFPQKLIDRCIGTKQTKFAEFLTEVMKIGNIFTCEMRWNQLNCSTMEAKLHLHSVDLHLKKVNKLYQIFHENIKIKNFLLVKLRDFVRFVQMWTHCGRGLECSNAH